MIAQVLSAQELDPAFEGALRLIDSEDGREVLIQAGGAAFSAYARALKAFLAEVSRTASKYAAPYALINAADDFEETALRVLLRSGIAAL